MAKRSPVRTIPRQGADLQGLKKTDKGVARMTKSKSVTVKLDTDLYQRVSDVSAVTGVSIRELFSNALEREVKVQLRRNERLERAVETMNEFRE